MPAVYPTPGARARQGKIARLPKTVRDELNERLLDGQAASVVLPWLNARPEVRAVVDAHFEGVAIGDQNLSAWRHGGFEDWLHASATRDLADRCRAVADADGGNISAGAAAELAGRIMSAIELDQIEDLSSAVDMVVKLRGCDLKAAQNDLQKLRAGQKDAEIRLAREKFERDTLVSIMAAAKQTLAVLKSDEPEDIKMEQLRLLIWGDALTPAQLS